MILDKLTLPALLAHGCAKYEHCLSLNFVHTGSRTYGDLRKDVASVACLLSGLGVRQGDKVAIFSANMPNWVIAQFAIAEIGAVYVPILPGFTRDDIRNILTHAEVKVLFVSKLLYGTVAGLHTEFLTDMVLSNNFAVIPEGFPASDIGQLAAGEAGCRHSGPLPQVQVEEEDTAAIIYTSGTTGFSKGVELTHRNLVWNAVQCSTIQAVSSSDRILSVLPLAHTYENTLGLLLPLMSGAAIYYLDRVPSPRLLVPALQKVRPTMMLSVPLVIEKLYKAQILPRFTRSKFTRMLYAFPLFRKVMNRMAGKVLYRTFGGCLTFFGIGGAKLDPQVERFLHEAKFPIALGYGLTETSPMTAGANPKNMRVGKVGPAMEGVEIMIDNPNKNGVGEILIRGPHVMKGYYKKPELTNMCMAPGGWFRSGDLGCLDKKGRLAIKGRIKTMFVGASGENIYPEEIESIINNFHLVEESIVVREKGKLVAIVNLKKEQFEEWFEEYRRTHKWAAKKQDETSADSAAITGRPDPDTEQPERAKGKRQHGKKTKNGKTAPAATTDAADDENETRRHVFEDIKKKILAYVNSKVNNFSKVNDVEITEEPFERTPTQKIKRYKYQKDDEMA